MNSPDQDVLIRAVEDARRILGEYIEPGPRDATRTMERLLAVLDRNEVILALDHIASGLGMILDILTVLFFILGFALILWMVWERRGDVLHRVNVERRRRTLAHRPRQR